MKTYIKKIGAGVVIMLSLLCQFAISASAQSDNATALVEYQQGTEFTVTIPEYIRPVDIGQEHRYADVTVDKAILPQGNTLQVSVDYTEVVTGDGNQKLPYEMCCDNTVITPNSVILEVESNETDTAVLSAELTAEPKYAGAYTDTAVFCIEVKKKAYTPEEIEKDPYLFGIGKTKSEYVLAKFNENFTAVTILKNGKDSDGLMMDWAKTTSATTANNSPMRQHKATLESVTVENGVVSIGNYAFYQCDKITSTVDLPKTVLYLGDGAYRECYGLTEMDLSNTKLESIGVGTFVDCYNITSALNLPETLKSIGASAFAASGTTLNKGLCMQFTGDLYLPDSVVSCGSATFQGCAKLDGVLRLSPNMTEIPDGFAIGVTSLTGDIIIPEGVTRIGNSAFYGKLAPASYDGVVVIPNTVTEIGTYAFSHSPKLHGDLVIPDTVKIVGDAAFSNCTGLDGKLVVGDGTRFIGSFAFGSDDGIMNFTSIEIGNSVEYIGTAAFQYCELASNEIILPDTLKVIGDFAFNHFESAANKNIRIPASVIQIGGTRGIPGITLDNYMQIQYGAIGTHTFYSFGTSAFKEYIVDAGNNNYKTVDGVLYSKDGTRLLSYPVGKEGTRYEIPEGVTKIDESAFNRGYVTGTTPYLKTLVLPDSYIIRPYGETESPQLNYKNSLANALYCYSGVEEIIVKESNPNYKTYDGCVYSKDGKICYYIPNYRRTVNILEGCETIEAAFFPPYTNIRNGESKVFTYNIPASVKTFVINAHDDGVIGAWNEMVDNKSWKCIINVDSDNSAYIVDAKGHLVPKI